MPVYRDVLKPWWMRQALPTAWGRYRRTAARIAAGQGDSRAVFEADLPEGGRWLLNYHVPSLQVVGLGSQAWGPRDEQGLYYLEVVAGRTKEVVEFDAAAADRVERGRRLRSPRRYGHGCRFGQYRVQRLSQTRSAGTDGPNFQRYLVVEELLGLPSVNWDRPRNGAYPVVTDVAEADRAARGLRTVWGLGSDPIPSLVELLEELGIKVLMVDVDDIDGLTARVRRRGGRAATVVVVNPSHTGERQRFTLAHELAHLVLDVARKLEEERAAHRFAGAFLMPAELLWSEVGKHRTSISIGELVDLKVLFGASVQAVTHRCKDLGIIGPTVYADLFREFRQRGWRTAPYPEPEPLQPEKPKRFERLCLRALAEDAVSESRAAELLGISVWELDRRMAATATAV